VRALRSSSAQIWLKLQVRAVIYSKTGRSAENLRWIQAVSHPVHRHRHDGAELVGGAPLHSQTVGRHARGSLRSSAVPGQRQSAYAAQSLPPRPPAFPLGVRAPQKAPRHIADCRNWSPTGHIAWRPFSLNRKLVQIRRAGHRSRLVRRSGSPGSESADRGGVSNVVRWRHARLVSERTPAVDGRVRGPDGRQKWIKAADLRRSSSFNQ
jgi:hypothetical protein